MTFNKFVCQYRKHHNLNDTRQLRTQLVERYVDLEMLCTKHNIPLTSVYYNPEEDQFYYKIKL